MKFTSIFKTKMQIFAGIAWVTGVVGIAYSAYSDLSSIDNAANAEKIKESVVIYLQMIALTTGVCMGAWGIPFYNWRNPSYKPFAVSDLKKAKSKK